MKAVYLTCKNEVREMEVHQAPDCIANLFTGRNFPVVANGALVYASYERDVDGVLLGAEIKHERILELALEEARNYYQDCIDEASKNSTKMVLEIYKTLDSFNPPWNWNEE